MTSGFVRRLCVTLAALLISLYATAEGGSCPSGYYPVGGAASMGCAPMPNGGAQQPAQSVEIWQDRYGAIAVDTQGGPLGVATDKHTRSAANKAAMDDCRAQGNTSCVLKSSYVNGCTALVTDSAGYSFTTKETLQEAIDDALQMCAAAKGKNCRLYYQGCSLPVRVR